MLTELDATEFDASALAGPDPVVVVFWATWCGYCKRVMPKARELGQDGARVVTVDLSDESSPLWDALGIQLVPTVMVWRDGRPGRRTVVLSADDMEQAAAAAQV